MYVFFFNLLLGFFTEFLFILSLPPLLHFFSILCVFCLSSVHCIRSTDLSLWTWEGAPVWLTFRCVFNKGKHSLGPWSTIQGRRSRSTYSYFDRCNFGQPFYLCRRSVLRVMDRVIVYKSYLGGRGSKRHSHFLYLADVHRMIVKVRDGLLDRRESRQNLSTILDCIHIEDPWCLLFLHQTWSHTRERCREDEPSRILISHFWWLRDVEGLLPFST